MNAENPQHPYIRDLCQPKAGQRFTIDGQEYALGEEIGDGAVGIVTKATRISDGLTRAIKFLAPDPKYIDVSAFDDVALRFKREGERGSNLDHPCLLEVYSYCDNTAASAFDGEGPSNPFILMEYVDGRTLESHIRQSKSHDQENFSVNKTRLQIALQIIEALDYLHHKKLVHRDVKPANIFISESIDCDTPLKLKLGDFGITKWGDFHSSIASGTLTATNQEGLGTLKYMAPEQAIAPKRVSVKADIFSLGITLFELLTDSVLASPHHVFQIMSARLVRGTTATKFSSMGYNIEVQDDSIGEVLLDMFLRGLDGRPTIGKARGILGWEYQRRFGEEFVI